MKVDDDGRVHVEVHPKGNERNDRHEDSPQKAKIANKHCNALR